MPMHTSKERRYYPRFPLSLKAVARALASYDSPSASAISARGQLRNISQGGVVLVSDRELPISGVVECRVFLPDVPVPIPTLLSVRWSKKRRSGTRYNTGLQFLF